MVGGGPGEVVLTYSEPCSGPSIVSSTRARGKQYRKQRCMQESIDRITRKRPIYRLSQQRTVFGVIALEFQFVAKGESLIARKDFQVGEALCLLAATRTTSVDRLVRPGFAA